MRQLSPTGQQAIDDIARRHGISTDAALSMLDAVVRGNGGMAQFSHPEFGGSGQWMRGGMTMVSDMFNNHLKSRVDALCFELSNLVASQPDLVLSGSFQSQSQNGQEQFSGSGYSYTDSSNSNGASLFVPPPPDWWGPTLRWPDSTGSQNGTRYANFAQARRLAIEANGVVTIYDTLDHQIGGFSQQQSYGGSLSFNSQYGLIDVASLPVISVNGVEPAAPAPYQAPPAPYPAPTMSPPAGGHTQDIFAMIERLADLRSKGVLDEAEFQAKKTELLGRL
ncbi:hypothetical protein GCM10007320_21660 [Pseudorhodoferax aquiterrae]|uniref:SHOCT domain-containing protein n=1 Tax=Pseudorhodoferax aquiterrae TaxID=747304 RepID=A0ABQ3G1T9_9BURK|nr:SHOCT domain-containing protein [Pseudorhodoferax aquiterrae]GHC80163.1 hypothetical protein GCM10007320_21660 [Pseudorhodoferax aquiterrae]